MKKVENKKSLWKKFGQLFAVQMLFKHLGFIVFIAALCVFYISNSHRAERKVREIQKLQTQINKNRYKYWESMSKVNVEGLQSRTEKRVKDLKLTTGETSIKVIKEDSKSESKEG